MSQGHEYVFTMCITGVTKNGEMGFRLIKLPPFQPLAVDDYFNEVHAVHIYSVSLAMDASSDAVGLNLDTIFDADCVKYANVKPAPEYVEQRNAIVTAPKPVAAAAPAKSSNPFNTKKAATTAASTKANSGKTTTVSNNKPPAKPVTKAQPAKSAAPKPASKPASPPVKQEVKPSKVEEEVPNVFVVETADYEEAVVDRSMNAQGTLTKKRRIIVDDEEEDETSMDTSEPKKEEIIQQQLQVQEQGPQKRRKAVEKKRVFRDAWGKMGMIFYCFKLQYLLVV